MDKVVGADEEAVKLSAGDLQVNDGKEISISSLEVEFT